MINKEIIIDGVDVSRCCLRCIGGECAVYYADLSRNRDTLEFGYKCEANPNCYYKQLKRSVQENEQLKKENFNLEEIIKLCMCEQYQQTLQEIKEIAKREFNKKLKDKDCFECDTSFSAILRKISEVME